MGELKSDIKVSCDKTNKVVTLIFEGRMEDYADPEGFFKKYGECKAICKDGTIHIDLFKLLPFFSATLPALSDQMADYATNFSKVLLILPENVVAKGQMKRMLKERNITDRFTFVDHF
ncbi:hypothetical protein [Anaerosporobacter faecicola]|uniref:hypothetical protein n=1 Tax=Anaerosporobacter faecicola TaxID=2718714 RepID=UPI001439281D|nr:hypothetical protein [Anaerosporobacter faecicola]